MSNIFPGDEGVIRVKVKDTRGDHVLVDSVNLPVREFWFPASYFERTAQGAASADNEKRAATSEPASPTATMRRAKGEERNRKPHARASRELRPRPIQAIRTRRKRRQSRPTENLLSTSYGRNESPERQSTCCFPGFLCFWMNQNSKRFSPVHLLYRMPGPRAIRFSGGSLFFVGTKKTSCRICESLPTSTVHHFAMEQPGNDVAAKELNQMT